MKDCESGSAAFLLGVFTSIIFNIFLMPWFEKVIKERKKERENKIAPLMECPYCNKTIRTKSWKKMGE